MTANAFSSAAEGLGQGIDALFGDQAAQFSMIDLEMIEVKAQIREEFEDGENTLADLAEHIKEFGVLQPILLRPTDSGYELIAGERRYRASKLAGLDQIPAFIRELTDEQADDAQLAENIHRKNLTQIEEAKKIQRDLDALGGDVDALLAKHKKSRAWLSKLLSLLSLPEQTKRLLSENISADLEVINQVKTIEKIDPEAAGELVNDLAESRGKESARKKTEEVKKKVKPPKKAKKAEEAPATESTARDKGELSEGINKLLEGTEESDALAAQAEAVWPSAGDEPTTATEDGTPAPSAGPPEPSEKVAGISEPAEVLKAAYARLTAPKSKESAADILNGLSVTDQEAVDSFLYGFYDAGVKAKEVGRAVLRGFENGQFATENAGAFALVAFMYGVEGGAKFDVLNVFGSIQK